MAIIVGGRVIAYPVPMAQTTSGEIQIAGFTSRAQAENLLQALEAG
jgi:hypothetical protein